MQSKEIRDLDSKLKSLIAIFGYAALVGTPIAYLDGILTIMQFSLLEILFVLSLVAIGSILFRRWKIEEVGNNKLYRIAGIITLFVSIPITTIFDLLMTVYWLSSILNPHDPTVIAGNTQIISMVMNFFIITGLLISIITVLAILMNKKEHK